MKAAPRVDCVRQDSDRINPFLSFIEQESYFSRDEFRSLRRRFPLTHWDRIRELHRGIRPDANVRALLDSRRSALEARNVELDLWRCPDIYLWIDRLLTSPTKEAFAEAMAHFDFLLGDAPPPFAGSRRLLRGRGSVYRATPSGWSQLTPSPVRRLGTGQYVYYPEGDLFNDLFESSKIRTTHAGSLRAADRSRLDAYMGVAIRLVQSYSRDLADDFVDAVAAVVLLKSNSEFHSGNFGLKYYGAVFVSPYSHNECSGAAALIHEYIHTCNWLLWTFVQPEGRPDDSVRLRSPITGNDVNAFSLCDAMMIYASNCDFYAWIAVSSDASSRLKNWAAARYRALVRHIPILHRLLIALVPDGTRYRRYIDHSVSCFQDTVKLYGAL